MNPQVSVSRAAIREFCRAHAVRELAVFGSAVRDDFSGNDDGDLADKRPMGGQAAAIPARASKRRRR